MENLFEYAPVLSLAAAVVVAGIGVVKASRKREQLPPGPPGLPLIGNAFNLPAALPWKQYLKWSHEYNSDVIYLRAPGASIVVLNSAEAVQELLLKRSWKYSSRPHSRFMHELMGFAWTFVFMEYGDRWKNYRKVFHQEYEVEEHPGNRAQELLSARRLIKRLLDTSGHVNPERELRLIAADTILSVTYGISPKSEDDPFIKIVSEATDMLSHAATGVFLVDYFSFLKYIPSWFPGATFKKIAVRGQTVSVDMRRLPLDYVKSEMAKGTAIPSVASRLLSSLPEDASREMEEDVSNILGTAYLAGADTTVAMIGSFILTMALFPDVQHKAQKAIDAAVGHGERLPEFSDYGSIPYIDALLDEVLRWQPMSPLGLFHTAAEDDIYKGYFIPRDSIIIPNGWAILHDTVVYGPDALDFRPERFLNDDGSKRADSPGVEFAFGYGRRKCPGRILARDAIFITATSLLATYEISDPRHLDGKPFNVEDVEFTSEMISRPPAFKCKFTSRSAAAAALVRHVADDVMTKD